MVSPSSRTLSWVLAGGLTTWGTGSSYPARGCRFAVYAAERQRRSVVDLKPLAKSSLNGHNWKAPAFKRPALLESCADYVAICLQGRLTDQIQLIEHKQLTSTHGRQR